MIKFRSDDMNPSLTMEDIVEAKEALGEDPLRLYMIEKWGVDPLHGWLLIMPPGEYMDKEYIPDYMRFSPHLPDGKACVVNPFTWYVLAGNKHQYRDYARKFPTVRPVMRHLHSYHQMMGIFRNDILIVTIGSFYETNLWRSDRFQAFLLRHFYEFTLGFWKSKPPQRSEE